MTYSQMSLSCMWTLQSSMVHGPVDACGLYCTLHFHLCCLCPHDNSAVGGCSDVNAKIVASGTASSTVTRACFICNCAAVTACRTPTPLCQRPSVPYWRTSYSSAFRRCASAVLAEGVSQQCSSSSSKPCRAKTVRSTTAALCAATQS